MADYPIPARRHRVEDSIRRSRFITTLAHAADRDAARSFVNSIRAEFPEATHNCWAFVAGPPGDTAHIGLSDDGEPSGTAGRPMLNVLLHSDVGEIAAVVTRYFGGTKLGTGGLVRAYGQGVRHALETLPQTLKVARRRLRIRLDYPDLGALERLLADGRAEVVAEDYGVAVELTLSLAAADATAFREQLTGLTSGRARIEPLD